ncbi:hypothetical protein CWS35_06535 [Bradyrhizobium sp. SK17]|uniref:hypothetical protein n=1 Tax=Bradyrhizobium sp. SK17 TaxID=2057741 RepID=UPI000C30AA7D|nr:hypothetical protein [Bradyrhizobium sp. SK17]AUC93985.1 hypothetical protein CWS35_06535 [Bradyrhizobium sp. SK17]
MSSQRRSYLKIWRWPTMLGGLTIAGLFAALLGQQGIWLPLSWASLTVPLVVILACLHRLRHG